MRFDQCLGQVLGSGRGLQVGLRERLADRLQPDVGLRGLNGRLWQRWWGLLCEGLGEASGRLAAAALLVT